MSFPYNSQQIPIRGQHIWTAPDGARFDGNPIPIVRGQSSSSKMTEKGRESLGVRETFGSKRAMHREVNVNQLAVGDQLLCESGRLIAVDAVRDVGERIPVYNFRIADHHTYFVGTYEWGWAVWAHNSNYCFPEIKQLGRRVWHDLLRKNYRVAIDTNVRKSEGGFRLHLYLGNKEVLKKTLGKDVM